MPIIWMARDTSTRKEKESNESNRREVKTDKKKRNRRLFITYTTAGLPDLEGTKRLIKAQEKAGVDLIELGVPFSDPVADGLVIQNASYQAICKGVTLKKSVSYCRTDA